MERRNERLRTLLVEPLRGWFERAVIRGFLEDSSPTAIIVLALRAYASACWLTVTLFLKDKISRCETERRSGGYLAAINLCRHNSPRRRFLPSCCPNSVSNYAPIASGAAAAGGYFFFLAAAVFAARACCFCLSALLWSACFWEDFFWLDFGDLSPMVLFFAG